VSPEGKAESEEPGALHAQWRAIAEERGSAFMLPEWYEAWMRHYGHPAEAQVVPTFASDGSLLGLMPLARRNDTLRFAGANLGDHFQPVAPLGSEHAVAAAVAPYLQDARYLILDHVDRCDRWPAAVQAASIRPLRRIASRNDVLPFIDLAGKSWEDYLGSRSRNFRSQVRRKTRKLDQEHDATFRRTEHADDLEGDLDTFFRLHDARWSRRGGSTLSTARSRSFHRDFAAALLSRGWLRLWFLELHGEPTACWYGWNIGGRYAYYLGGFAPEWNEHSVGFVLLAHTIRAATEEGAYEYDLLRGGEDYKSRFATSEREIETVVLVHAASPARVIVWAEAALWSLSQRMPDPVRSAGQWLYSLLRNVAPMGKTR
jgi:CelD/BcsL family acetyltransferase involved in cellulose biosynthesis